MKLKLAQFSTNTLFALVLSLSYVSQTCSETRVISTSDASFREIWCAAVRQSRPFYLGSRS